MKVRDSGMPDEATWEGFFDPRAILAALHFPRSNPDVVDFGCGYGTFSIAAASLTRGKVYALDIDPAMVAATAAGAAKRGLANVVALERDVIAVGTGLPDASVGYAMLFNILHAEQPLALLAETLRVLRPGGTAAVIHWRHDTWTPRGPALSIRPTPGQCGQWLQQAGFTLALPRVDLPPYHYGVLGVAAAVNDQLPD